jgi:hemoglobin
MDVTVRQTEEPGFGPTNLPYEAIGGEAGVRGLVEAFYDTIARESPSLLEMHGGDLTQSRERLFEFLSGWLGGPQLFIERHGHPRLRMRHAHVRIDQAGVEEWMRCMRVAMDARGIEGPLRAFLEGRFLHTAEFMRNAE